MSTPKAVIDFAKEISQGIKEKADKNKNFSTFLFLVVLLATVITPLLILISDNFWVSKVSPAVLSASAALASYWIQLRKPHERWALYRTTQREIESEINKYTYSIEEYREENRDTLLAKKVNELALNLHYEWMPMVPTTKELQAIKTTDHV
ncbi:DUF4231 domain-containing protein [Elizabethkingia anophelis]|uniref:DUF4231 domain-containing protein n=1 Tax=Elizabethkingia anophelis TaxID=1117645 RepID=A0A455ZEU9_9FLAO|nr:DUF4231 domain-containing protein [Elizabethkingia anophelis]AKH95207.1 hypothetical protein M876_11580 [Elizabethkingia anophelis FMS-007]DAC75292.1 TPA_exp: hypothetical protein [Elizabethkingia anophelis]